MISWQQSSTVADSIDMFIVQVDSYPPIHMSAETTSAYLPLNSSSADGHEHVITVTTVDKCGQSSNSVVLLNLTEILSTEVVTGK